MGDVTRVETFQPAAPQPTKPDSPVQFTAEQIARASQIARTPNMVTRANADVPAVDPSQPSQPTKVSSAQAPGDRPSWLPEKFKTPEDMAKAYGELEKKQGSQTAKPAEEPKPGAPATDKLKLPEGDPAEAPKDQPDATKVVESAGLKMDELSAEYMQKGELSKESRAKLNAAGITDNVIDGYIAGQHALAEKITQDVESVAGGNSQFKAMQTWAAQNLPMKEKQALNSLLDSGNHEAIKVAFAGVHAKYVAAVGRDPSGALRGTTGGPTGPGDTFRDLSELLQAQKDPRYKTSEAFRQDVMLKLKRSNI